MRMDKRELKWEHMLAGISSQPAYVRDGAAQALHAATVKLPLRVPSRIYLVGCGDSHYAGSALEERPFTGPVSVDKARALVEQAQSGQLTEGLLRSG